MLMLDGLFLPLSRQAQLQQQQQKQQQHTTSRIVYLTHVILLHLSLTLLSLSPSLSLSNRQIEFGECNVFVGGSTTSIPCDDFDRNSTTPCDVAVQFTYLISNTEEILPSSMPSAEPSAEPSISASPTTSKKSGKGSKTGTSSDGKGNGKGKVVTIGPSPAPKVGVVPETLIELLSNFIDRRLARADPSCPEGVFTVDIPAGTILAPGESINVTGSLIEFNDCECGGSFGAAFTAGVTGNPTPTEVEVGDTFACSAATFLGRA
jgi:hypothetical protein